MTTENAGAVSADKWLIIAIDCAECRGGGEPPLARITTVCDDEARAKSIAAEGWIVTDWLDHPQGGSFLSSGGGDTWVVPLSALQNPLLIETDVWYGLVKRQPQEPVADETGSD